MTWQYCRHQLPQISEKPQIGRFFTFGSGFKFPQTKSAFVECNLKRSCAVAINYFFPGFGNPSKSIVFFLFEHSNPNILPGIIRWKRSWIHCHVAYFSSLIQKWSFNIRVLSPTQQIMSNQYFDGQLPRILKQCQNLVQQVPSICRGAKTWLHIFFYMVVHSNHHVILWTMLISTSS